MSWPRRDPITNQMIGEDCWNSLHEHGQVEANTAESTSCDCWCHYSPEVLAMKEEGYADSL